MKAALCKSLGGPDAISIEEIPDPTPEAAEVVIRVRAAALNFFDTLITRGKYQYKPEPPFSPSGEVAGVIESMGQGVTGLKPGDRVMATLGWGGAREKVVVKATAAIPLPDAVSDTSCLRPQRHLRHRDPRIEGPRQAETWRNGRRPRGFGWGGSGGG